MTNSIKDVEIRQASAADIKLFYPDGPPRTTYSWVALYKGIPSCLAGLIVERGGCIAYMELKPGNYPNVTMGRTALALMKHIENIGLPMFAMCDPANEKAQAFVTHLGFNRQRAYEGVELFKWG